MFYMSKTNSMKFSKLKIILHFIGEQNERQNHYRK